MPFFFFSTDSFDVLPLPSWAFLWTYLSSKLLIRNQNWFRRLLIMLISNFAILTTVWKWRVLEVFLVVKNLQCFVDYLTSDFLHFHGYIRPYHFFPTPEGISCWAPLTNRVNSALRTVIYGDYFYIIKWVVHSYWSLSLTLYLKHQLFISLEISFN